MKLITADEFLKLPEKTLYQKYSPNIFFDLSIKEKSIFHEDKYIDFFYRDMLASPENEDTDSGGTVIGPKFKMDTDGLGRDGTFDHEQMYAVYEKEDIEQLINAFKECL